MNSTFSFKALRTSLAILLSLFACNLLAQTGKVYVLELHDEIHPSSSRYMTKGFDEATANGASLVLIHMNTFGGMVEFADSIRSKILDCKIPTVVFIDKNAASAGALISLACDSIYMAPGSSIGAATVVSGSTGEAMPDKYQSYMRSIMRATAEMKGRNPAIAEKMVDQNLEIPGLSPKGTVITFTPAEAITNGFSNGNANSIEEVMEKMGQKGAQIISYESPFIEKIILFLINPAVSGVLLMLIFGGLFMELKAPGLGLPGGVALGAAILFFAPHYIEGLAQSWEILIFIAGVVLIALEIFVIPGFGVTGISGIILVILGLAIALVRNNALDFNYVYLNDGLRSFAIVILAMATAIILVVWLARYVVSETRAFPFVDLNTQDKAQGYTAVNQALFGLIGKEAHTMTDLKPAGFISLDGKRLDAESEGEYIERGTAVLITAVKNISLVVKKK